MFRKLRFWAKLLIAFLSRFKKIIFGGIIFGLALFLSLNFIKPNLNKTKTETIGITGRYHIGNLPLWILQLIGSGLVGVDQSGNLTADIATSWEQEDEGKTWIFKLDANRTWHDGTQLKASDLTFDFPDVQYEIQNPDTVVFRIPERFAPFPATLNKPLFKKGLLGTGDWSVNKITLQAGFVETLQLEDKNNNTLTLRFFPSDDATKLAYKLGKINIIHETLDPVPFNNWETSKVSQKIDTQKYAGVFINTQDSLLSDKSLRQALNYAIDKDALSSNRAISPISLNSWAYNPLVKTYDYDKQRAIELLESLPSEQKEKLAINLVTLPSLLPVAETIKQYWEAIGIATQIQVAAVPPTQFQALLAIHEIPLDPDQYSIWHSTQKGTNITNYTNPRIDKLLEDGRQIMEQQERKAIYIDFQRFLVEDTPAIFLYYPTTYSITRK